MVLGGRRLAGAGLMRRGEARGFGGGALTVDAGADSAAWVSATQTLAGSASGGVAPYTHLWTVQSGPGTVTGETTLTPTVTATAPGTIVVRLTTTDAVGTIVYDEVTLAATFAAVITAGTGFTRRWWFECSDGTVTRDGSNLASQVSDRWANGWHLAQGTASNKPLYEATAGPQSLPCVSSAGSNDWIGTAAVSIAAGSRPFRIVVVKAAATNDKYMIMAREGATPTSGNNVLGFYRGVDKFTCVTKQTAGAEIFLDATTPAIDTNWHIQSIDYNATALTWLIDGVAADPQPTGAGTAVVIEHIAWGHPTVSGGSVAADICVDSPTAAVKTFIYNYLDQIYFP